MSHEVEVDWSSATVAPSSGASTSLELRVELTPEPDGFWRNAFDDLRQRRGDGRAGWPEKSWASYGGKLSVGYQPGDEDAIRSALDELVRDVNPLADTLEADWDTRVAKKEADVEALRRAAENATERFRSGS
jgi:hypothetical protein